MISARRAALLGLDSPLSAIMAAVLGIWPEAEDEPEVITIPARTIADPKGGGKVEPVRKKADDGEWLTAQRKRMKSQLDAVIAMVCAIAEESVRMSSVSQCLLKHFGAKSPIAAYRADMAGDARELIDGGMNEAAAWAQVTRAKLADLQAEKSRIEQSVADAYSKTAAGKPVEQKAAETPPTSKRRVFKTRKAAEAERDQLGNEHKLQKIKGGYTLRLKSEKELAAAVKNGQRLSARKSVDTANDPLLAAIAKLGGLDMSTKADTITEGNRNIGGKMVFTNTGALVDEMASQLHDLGYIPHDDYESDGGVRWLEGAIEAEFAGTKHYSEVGGEDRMEADRIAAQGDEPQPFTPEGDAADAARAERARALAESADTIEFRHPSGDGRFVIAGPDMSKPGQFRLTRFDTDGPYSHVEFKSLDGAIDEALLQGYQPEPLADFTPEDLDSSGYDAASPEAQELTEAILADAEAAGIDTEALREDAARATEGKSDAEYHAEVQRAATEAIARHRQDAGRSDAEAARGSNQDRGEVAGDQGQEGLTLEAQSASDLKAKAEREAAAKAADAKEQKRLADKATADAQRNEFTLTGSDRPADTGAAAGQRSVFDEPKFSISDSAPKTLQAVRKQWEDSGIKGSLSEKEGTIELSRIVVPKGERNLGVGTRAMQALANYADATGQRIVLSPDTSFGGTSVTRLTAFYKRFGFKENKGRSRDFTTRERMIREPRTDDAGNVALFSVADSPWYSALSRQVESAKFGAAPASAWRDWLRGLASKGVKPDEIAWSGIEEWLALQQGKVTKAQVSEYLSANGVQVKETVLGDDAENSLPRWMAGAPRLYG